MINNPGYDYKPLYQILVLLLSEGKAGFVLLKKTNLTA